MPSRRPQEAAKEARPATPRTPWAAPGNKLILGENLQVLHKLVENAGIAGKVDLIYIDPPFSTNLNFFIHEDRANTISHAGEGKIAYSDRLTGEDFLAFLRQRLILLRELLSPQGSIYLHIDCKVGHYVKVLMDEIFGAENFRNDITRIKCNPKNFKRKAFGNMKDMILFYTRGNDYIWNEPIQPYSQEDLQRLFPKVDANGRRYTTVPIHAPGETRNGKSAQPFRGMLPPKGRHWRTDVETLERWDAEGLIEWSRTGNPRKKIYADERTGKRVQDIWEFKDPQHPLYPTQKNLDMLRLIVRTSSNAGSTVLDCFCGSGTTLVAAQELGRKWIGIDESEQAISVTRQRLEDLQADNLFSQAKYQYIEAE